MYKFPLRNDYPARTRLMRAKQPIENLSGLAEVIGWDAVLLVVRRFGGQRFYVRLKMRDDDPLVDAIGQEAAALMVEHYGNTEIYLPITLRREAEVRALIAAEPGISANEVARRVGVSYRYVEKLVNRKATLLPGNDRDTPQLSLFG